MAQWAGRASGDLHTFMYFNKHGPKSQEAVVTRVRKSGIQVVIPRYGIDGVVPVPDGDWEVNEDEQCICSLKDKGHMIRVFEHVMVRIEADNADFRNRTTLTYEGVVAEGQRQAFAEVEQARKAVQKEMFPDRLVQEAN